MAKVLVEDCLCLDVVILTRPGPLQKGFGGTYYFYKDGEEIESIPWEFLDDCLRLHCWRVGRDGKPVFYSYWVLVTYTPTEFKGKRAWFQCPGCDRRVRKLFRPPEGNTNFMCRDCHGLTYASQQRQSERWFKAMERELALREWQRMRGLDRTQALEEEADRVEAYLEAGRSLAPLLRYINGRGELPPVPPGGWPKAKRPYNRTRPFTTGERKNPRQRLCLKCRDWREMEDPQPVTLPNGRPALQGRCPVCEATMIAIVKGS
jgi:hypothetical protein